MEIVRVAIGERIHRTPESAVHNVIDVRNSGHRPEVKERNGIDCARSQSPYPIAAVRPGLIRATTAGPNHREGCCIANRKSPEPDLA